MPTESVIRLYAVNCAGLDLAAAAPLLTPDRAARIAQMCTDGARRLSAAAGLLLRFACCALLGHAPAAVERESDGKPYLPDRPDFHFSLSHSGDWALCAVGFSPVGADIQRIQPVSDALRRRFFTPEERELCTDDEAAIRIFCARESHGKLTGRGISQGPVLLRGAALCIDGIPIAEPAVAAGYRAAVCSEAPVASAVTLPTYEALLYRS